jgi:heme-degrading monooxygenase HmoA
MTHGVRRLGAAFCAWGFLGDLARQARRATAIVRPLVYDGPTMIARIWSAHTTADNWPAYEHHFVTNVVPELRTVDGYVSANLLKRDAGSDIEITVITVWRDLDAIAAFAGPDREAAVVTPSAAALLTSYGHRVRHYELTFSERA